jgi:hypothetical protein
MKFNKMTDKEYEEWFKKETSTPAGQILMAAYIGYNNFGLFKPKKKGAN